MVSVLRIIGAYLPNTQMSSGFVGISSSGNLEGNHHVYYRNVAAAGSRCHRHRVLYFRRLLPIELFKIRLIHKELPNLLFYSIKVTYILHINKRKVQQLQRFMIQLPFQSGRRRQSVDVSFSSFPAQR